MAQDGAPTGDQEYRLRSDAVDWLDVDEEVVALDGERSVYLSTNSSGALLWHSLADGATFDQLTGALMETYGIDEQRARTDVTKFLEMLGAQGLLQDR